MRESFTAVLERNRTLAGEFATEPYEAAWAAEARWFVRTLERTGAAARMRVTTQVSPDGLHWCDLDAEREIAGDLVSWESTGFGGWLRLKGVVDAADGTDAADGADAPAAKVMIYLALKS
ncbi:hypothetical protein [Actinomadura sp. WAC 06369]|uniref:hypothetical protein n=1 Tax=Actinomadura sp. WAC 06369 TaxID=2203193 RepID=UPI000F7A1BE0|nr:hypothetical protein [Actinomadura sp. WAC 06369]RSN68695.1 hypothetical protein DMH08_10260 [Actinomadura sp. WAC 06369]